MDCPSQDQWPPQGESCAGVLGPCPFFVAKGTVMVLCHCVEEVFLCYYAADNCPWEPPYDGSFCPEPDLRCQYSSQTCQCTDYSWTCGRSSDSSNDSNQDSTCPNSRPTSGDTCGLSASIPCLYSDSLCTCGNGTWDCGPYCPTEEPGPDEMCGIPSELACYYDLDQCVCGSDETWDCEPYCPAEEPAGDDECNIPFEFLCYYDKNECVCGSDGTWDCESYCPSEEPAGKYCDLPGYLTCPYEAS